MPAKIKYSDEPLGKLEVLTDFLPSPPELAFREEGVKVTLALSKKSVEFFKSEAAKHQTQYQRMIRRLSTAMLKPIPWPFPRAGGRTGGVRLDADTGSVASQPFNPDSNKGGNPLPAQRQRSSDRSFACGPVVGEHGQRHL